MAQDGNSSSLRKQLIDQSKRSQRKHALPKAFFSRLSQNPPKMPVRFLIADDMPAQQRLLANVVLFLGGESRFASNGREALQLAREEQFDIVLLDLSMPELGGVAAANELLESWESLDRRPRIVTVTGEKDEGIRTLCRAVGMDGFIAKPFSVATVRKTLRTLLMQGHCWPEGPARRFLDVEVSDAHASGKSTGFELEVLEARTLLQELVEGLDALTEEQRMENSQKLAIFAGKHGLVLLRPAMETLTQTARESEAATLSELLREQRADFEDAIIALRAWSQHAPRVPLRMSA
jgi:CheY-like chemotaxis protein